MEEDCGDEFPRKRAKRAVREKKKREDDEDEGSAVEEKHSKKSLAANECFLRAAERFSQTLLDDPSCERDGDLPLGSFQVIDYGTIDPGLKFTTGGKSGLSGFRRCASTLWTQDCQRSSNAKSLRLLIAARQYFASRRWKAVLFMTTTPKSAWATMVKERRRMLGGKRQGVPQQSWCLDRKHRCGSFFDFIVGVNFEHIESKLDNRVKKMQQRMLLLSQF